jgi:hypothetical protein
MSICEPIRFCQTRELSNQYDTAVCSSWSDIPNNLFSAALQRAFLMSTTRQRISIEDYSKEEARELIFYFIRWGNHRDDFLRTLSDNLVEACLADQRFSLKKAVEELQNNPHRAIARFENLFTGGTWEIEASPGLKVKHSLLVDGVAVKETEVKGHAILRQAHIADFDAACKARDAAIKTLSFDEFYSALSKGFSSMEAYLNLRVAVYNSKRPPDEQISEKKPKGGFLTLDEKIKTWLPKMTGWQIETGNSAGWLDFQYLKQIRNDVVIHPKPDAGFTTVDELADGINKFRTGIGGLMFAMHQFFGERIPGTIIRAMRYPKVKVVSANEAPDPETGR